MTKEIDPRNDCSELFGPAAQDLVVDQKLSRKTISEARRHEIGLFCATALDAIKNGKDVAEDQDGRKWRCRDDVIFNAAQHYGVDSRTVETALADYRAIRVGRVVEPTTWFEEMRRYRKEIEALRQKLSYKGSYVEIGKHDCTINGVEGSGRAVVFQDAPGLVHCAYCHYSRKLSPQECRKLAPQFISVDHC
jgi:hypothetical protein